MNGLGAEVAKNVILANVGSVVIHGAHASRKCLLLNVFLHFVICAFAFNVKFAPRQLLSFI